MKKLIFIIIIVVNAILFLIYPTEAVDASKTGIMLWFYQVFPTLFPWTILSNVMIHSNFISIHPNYHKKMIQKEELFILFCGFLFGFPIGSKLTVDFYEAGLLKKERAQILCACSNQLSLSYISGFVIAQILQLKHYIEVYLFIVYGPSFILGVVLLIWENYRSTSYVKFTHKKSASRFLLNMQIIDAGIINGFEALIKLCGYIVMFSILSKSVEILIGKKEILTVVISNILETTGGLSKLNSAPLNMKSKYLISICAINLGGLSCLAQTGSILAKTDLSLLKYSVFRITTAILSTSIAYYVLFILRIS